MDDVTVYQLSAIAVLIVITASLSYLARRMPSKSKRRVAPSNQNTPLVGLPTSSTSQEAHTTNAFVQGAVPNTQPAGNTHTIVQIQQGKFRPTTKGVDECGISDAVFIIPGAVNYGIDEIDDGDPIMVNGNEEGKLESQDRQVSLTDDRIEPTQKNGLCQEQNVATLNQPPYAAHPSGYYQPASGSGELHPQIPSTLTENLDEHQIHTMATIHEEELDHTQSVSKVDNVAVNIETNIDKETIENQMQEDGDQSDDVAVVDAGLSHELNEIAPENNMAATITDEEMMATLKISSNSILNSADNLDVNNDSKMTNSDQGLNGQGVVNQGVASQGVAIEGLANKPGPPGAALDTSPDDSQLQDPRQSPDENASVDTRETENQDTPNVVTSGQSTGISDASPKETPVNEGEAEDRDENSCGKTTPIIGSTDEDMNVNHKPLEKHVVGATVESNIETSSSSVEVNNTQETDQISSHPHETNLKSESEDGERNVVPTEDDGQDIMSTECSPTNQDTSQSHDTGGNASPSGDIGQSVILHVDTERNEDPSEDTGRNASTSEDYDKNDMSSADANQNVERSEDAERIESPSEDHAQTNDANQNVESSEDSGRNAGQSDHNGPNAGQSEDTERNERPSGDHAHTNDANQNVEPSEDSGRNAGQSDHNGSNAGQPEDTERNGSPSEDHAQTNDANQNVEPSEEAGRNAGQSDHNGPNAGQSEDTERNVSQSEDVKNETPFGDINQNAEQSAHRHPDDDEHNASPSEGASHHA